ncbi:hypothetical protein KKE60_04510 [Patescibacteria group bacterium]|nr:hypothetical protein [Patescibacteria group bacterium]
MAKNKLKPHASPHGNRVAQQHHIQYESEGHPQHDVVVTIFKGEHLILTRMQWYCKKTISKGFVKALKVWIALNEDKAVDIEQ